MIRKTTILLLLCLVQAGTALARQSAEAFLDEVIDRLHAATGITASFTLTGDTGNTLYMQGELKMKGKKFFMQTNGMTTWYDGKTMWSYADAIGEVNITEPSAQELMSINPYLAIDKYKKMYAASDAESPHSGERCICLTTTDRNAQFTRIMVTISTSTLAPLTFELTDANRNVSRITVTSYKTNAGLTDDTFVFDAADYPEAAVIDLR